MTGKPQPTLPEAIALARNDLKRANEHLRFEAYNDAMSSICGAIAALDSLQVMEPVGDHIEDVRGMVPHQPLKPAGEEDKATYKQIADNYTQPADCARCAELSESINNRAREQAQKAVNNGVYLDKLATLEAEKEEIKQAIRWAPSSAHWSNVLIKLCGEDSFR